MEREDIPCALSGDRITFVQPQRTLFIEGKPAAVSRGEALLVGTR